MSSEARLSKRIGLALSRLGCRVFRNQVGVYELADGRWLSSGLGKGSGDRVGWRSIVITPDMVGQRLAVFLSIEVKGGGGRVEEEQLVWAQVVRDAGGRAGIAFSEQEAIDIADGKA